MSSRNKFQVFWVRFASEDGKLNIGALDHKGHEGHHHQSELEAVVMPTHLIAPLLSHSAAASLVLAMGLYSEGWLQGQAKAV